MLKFLRVRRIPIQGMCLFRRLPIPQFPPLPALSLFLSLSLSQARAHSLHHPLSFSLSFSPSLSCRPLCCPTQIVRLDQDSNTPGLGSFQSGCSQINPLSLTSSHRTWCGRVSRWKQLRVESFLNLRVVQQTSLHFPPSSPPPSPDPMRDSKSGVPRPRASDAEDHDRKTVTDPQVGNNPRGWAVADTTRRGSQDLGSASNE